MLQSKQDFEKYLHKILEPLKKYYTPGKSGVKCGESGVHYGEKIAMMEGFARPLWGLGPLWCGGGTIREFDKIYLEGIINGTDPEHEEFWGKIKNGDQKLVETAPIGLAMILAPEIIWNPLNEKQKRNLCEWLWQVNTVSYADNNWNFFPVLVNLGLKTVGAEYDAEKIKFAISRIDSFYKGNGWYSDGNTKQVDYYIAFAMHFYGLIYAKVMEKEDVEHSQIFKERAMLFAKDFIYWFAEDGASIAYGRSLTYRFAQCSFWCACVFAGIEPFSIGVMKGIIVRHLEYWMKQPIFDNGGVLSIGYAYPNINISEEYNAFGSPYWALKAFLILALADNHKFYKQEALPLPDLDDIHIIKEANMVIQRINGYVVALTAGQWVEWNPMHVAEKYSKFAYSSKYAFCVPRTYCKLEGAGTDSMLVFIKDDMCFVRRKCIEYKINDDGTIYSKWMPCSGIEVETYIILTTKGHNRKHIIHSTEACIAYDCAFATADEKGDISGIGEKVNIKCVPNTNLIENDARIQAVKYNISVGINEIETIVEYPF